MAYKVGDRINITEVPITLYYDSVRAASKNTYQSGQWYTTGLHAVTHVRYANNGTAYTSPQSPDDVPLYAINHPEHGYGIGWIRDDALSEKVAQIENILPLKIEASTPVSLSDFHSSNRYVGELSLDGDVIHTFDVSENPYRLVIPSSVTDTIVQRTSTLSVTLSLNVLTYDRKNKLIGGSKRNFAVDLSGAIRPPIISNTRITSSELIGGKLYTGAGFTVQIEANSPDEQRIVRYETDINGKKYAGQSFSTSIAEPGRYTLTATVYDSRGQSATRKWKLIIYERPRVELTEQSVTRISDVSARVSLKGDVDSNFISDVETDIYFKNTSTGRVDDNYNLVNTVNNGVFNVEIVTERLNPNGTYLVEIILNDGTFQTNLRFNLGTTEIPMAYGKHGVSAGKRFDNEKNYNLQVGTGGAEVDGNLSVLGDILMQNQLLGNFISSEINRIIGGMNLGGSGSDFEIMSAYIGSSYGRIILKNGLGVKFGKATVSGVEYTVDFNNSGGYFRTPPFVVVNAVSGRWEFAFPSLTAVTNTSFTASTVNAANQQGFATDHDIYYIAFGQIL